MVLLKFLTLVGAPLFLICAWLTAEHFPPWVSWHNEVWAFTAAIVGSAAGLALLKAEKAKNVIVPFSVLKGVLFCCILWIQYFLGSIVFLGDVVVITIYVFLCFLGLMLGHYAVIPVTRSLRVGSAWPSVDYFAAIVLTGAVCSTGIALAQVLQVSDGVAWIAPNIYSRRPGGNLGQPNQLATLSLMGFASLLYLYELGRLQVISALVICVPLICGFAITESRTGLLSILLMVCWWCLRHRRVGFRVRPAALHAGAAACLAAFWCWPPVYTFINAGGLQVDSVAQVNTDASLRVVIWPQLLEAVAQRPWFGWGMGQVAKAHNAVLHANYLTSEPYTYAHNIVLDSAVGMGLPLTVLVVYMTIVWLWRSVRATRSILSWYCLAMILPFGVHSLLEFPFAYAYFLLPIMFVIGIQEGLMRESRVIEIPWIWVTIAFSIAASAMAWSAWEYLLLEDDFRVARFESMRVGKTPVEYERPKIYMLTQLHAFASVARIKPAPNMSMQELALTRDVALHYPIVPMQNRYALSLALNGNPEEALAQLKIMKAMHFTREYEPVRQYWHQLAETTYPQLAFLQIP